MVLRCFVLGSNKSRISRKEGNKANIAGSSQSTKRDRKVGFEHHVTRFAAIADRADEREADGGHSANI